MASGMLLIPELTGPDDRTLPDADRLVSEATSFVGRDAVAFWSLAENLGRSIDLETRKTTLRRVRDAALAIRKAKPGGSPLTTGTVLGMLPEYARIPENLDVIGIPTANWATTQEPFEMVPVSRPAPALDGPEQRRRPVLGHDRRHGPADLSGVDLGDRHAAVWGLPSGPARADPPSDLRRAGGGLPGDLLPGRLRPDPGDRPAGPDRRLPRGRLLPHPQFW